MRTLPLRRKKQETIHHRRTDRGPTTLAAKKNSPKTIVKVKVAFEETELRQIVKDAGAKWSKSTKTWKMPYKTALDLGLKKRIINDNHDNE